MTLHEKAYGIVVYCSSKNDLKILLCKSINNKHKWGCLKGSKNKNETAFECAKREFLEESSINVEIVLYEEYFEQININKDIGIWLVNSKNLYNFHKYFKKNTLKKRYLCWENSKVKLFSINNLPKIKKNQKKLILDIKDFLKNKNLYH